MKVMFNGHNKNTAVTVTSGTGHGAVFTASGADVSSLTIDTISSTGENLTSEIKLYGYDYVLTESKLTHTQANNFANAGSASTATIGITDPTDDKLYIEASDGSFYVKNNSTAVAFSLVLGDTDISTNNKLTIVSGATLADSPIDVTGNNGTTPVTGTFTISSNDPTVAFKLNNA